MELKEIELELNKMELKEIELELNKRNCNELERELELNEWNLTPALLQCCVVLAFTYLNLKKAEVYLPTMCVLYCMHAHLTVYV